MRRMWKLVTESALVRIGLSLAIVAVAAAALGGCGSKEVAIDQPSEEDMTPEEREVQENIRRMMEAPASPPPAVQESLEQDGAE